MNVQEKSRQEYRSRINRVMDFIDHHIDQPLDLSKVAGLANFSTFHFHQIFTFLVGETPVDYIQRLRLEKAAQKLRNTSRKMELPMNYTTMTLQNILKENIL